MIKRDVQVQSEAVVNDNVAAANVAVGVGHRTESSSNVLGTRLHFSGTKNIQPEKCRELNTKLAPYTTFGSVCGRIYFQQRPNDAQVDNVP